MLDILNFVRGAVSGDDRVMPVLSYFCIYKGRIQGANGRISIDAPCPELKLDAITPAEKLVRAIDNCTTSPSIQLTAAGRLSIRSEGFRAVLPTQGLDTFPTAKATNTNKLPIDAGLCDTLSKLRPFIATDAERAWASTVYFDAENGVAYASTNAAIAMMKVKPFESSLQLPVFAIDELLRIYTMEGFGEPRSFAVDENSITFFWPKRDAWLKTQLIAAEWPTKTAEQWMQTKAKMIKLPDNIGAEIERLLPFCPNPKHPVIHFDGALLSTSAGDSEASIELPVVIGKGAFHAENLRPMLQHADKMAITEKVGLFAGENFKGVMSLLRTG